MKDKLRTYIEKQISDENFLLKPPYPGELLILFGLKSKAPLVMVSSGDSRRLARDAEFFFDRILYLENENINQVASALTSGDFELLLVKEEKLSSEIPLQDRIVLKVGESLPMDELIICMDEAGMVQKSRVYEKEEYVRRGGVIDLWTSNIDKPVRIEFFDNCIHSIRYFEPSSQLSVEKVNKIELLVSKDETVELKDKLDKFLTIGDSVDNFKPDIEFTSGGKSLDFIPSPLIHRDLDRFRHELNKLSDYEIYVVVNTPGEEDRMRDLFKDEYPGLIYLNGLLSRGFIVDEIKLALFTESDIFGLLRAQRSRTEAKVRKEEERVFSRGDLVVHEDFGIGRYRGLEKVEIDRKEMECMIIEYRDESRVLVPIGKSHLVSQYISGGDSEPALSLLSRKKWNRKKRKVKEDLKKLAEEMLKLYAKREHSEGYKFSENDSLQRELELTFPFTETKDQIEAINEVYEDMEKQEPMDRLLCGEVGFGKTEVALRAAFKAVTDSKQVAILTPTTVLAKQHYDNFKKRLDKFPVNVELLSRFTKRREKEIMKKLEKGVCDVVIGTHKLLSSKINFSDLGLLIIDEEQRFGVKQKDKLKKYRVNLDVLSMSATPIPRTLELSLLSLRNLSLIETPPEGRKGVITEVIKWDDKKIRDAVLKEIERNGQVFFVHNRVRSIKNIKKKLQQIIPEVSIVVAHGQLPTGMLEERMTDFIEGKYEMLLSTAIIESGLDMSNVNTIIIDKAQDFGLADLHQLRGRVGRSIRQGYCYLIVEEDITDSAEERISAIKTYSELGAGFKLSLRDLEIRGAGDILGPRQHGHIALVGYELYLKMLREAIKEVKGEKVEKPSEVDVSLMGSFYIPKDYIEAQEERISIYRRLSAAESLEEVDELGKEIEDRFGRPPENIGRLLKWAKMRILAEKSGIKKIKEGLKNFHCQFEKELTHDEIREIVSEIQGLKFSYGEYLKVSVPREKIFDFLKYFFFD